MATLVKAPHLRHQGKRTHQKEEKKARNREENGQFSYEL